MSHTDASDIVNTIDKYIAAWNATGSSARRLLLRECWGDDATYIDPTVSLIGRGALERHIESVGSRRPGSHLELMSGVDHHHNVLRFLWRLVQADGSHGSTSIDFGEIGRDGRLTKIAGFFGPLTAAGAYR